MTTPTFRQMQQFFRFVEEGKITVENFQMFLNSPNKFFMGTGSPVTIDYSLSFKDMVAVGKYDWVHDNITPEHFSLDGVGAVEHKLRTIGFGRTVTHKDVEEYYQLSSLELPKIEHLLAFGAKFPVVQRENPIVALGSSWVHPDGTRFVPYLGTGDSGRCLNLFGGIPSRVWSSRWRFLAVVISNK